MWFGEPHASPERISPTRLSMSGQTRYKGWSCKTSYNFPAPKIFIFRLTFQLGNAMVCSICRIVWAMLQRGRPSMVALRVPTLLMHFPHV